MGLFLFILLILAVVYVLKGVIIVQQTEEMIIERWGKFHAVLRPGLNFIIPFIDTPHGITMKISQKGIDGQTYPYVRVMNKIDMRESVYDFPRQNVITKDNVTISINALLYFQIVDSRSAVY